MDRPLSSVMLAEVYGTFLLTFGGTAAIVAASDAAAFPVGPTLGLGFIGLAFGISLVAGIATVGTVSGAHFNSAVTLALTAAGRFPARRAPAYIVSQFIGATLAAAVLLGIVGQTIASSGGVDLGSTVPNLSLPTPETASLIAEIVGTMFLAFVILGSTDPDSSGTSWGTLGIGLTLAASIWALGSVSGASLNPARSFGPAFVSLLFDKTPIDYYWIYVAGPVLGGLVAAMLYRLIYRRQPA